jgi:hypothetical protein
MVTDKLKWESISNLEVMFMGSFVSCVASVVEELAAGC